ncbi:non-specific lipid-transfer protein 4-like [Impatiens glandulifera]|uniref:non-specific lipid-transfer protein 4-like n=1 Tax=Impatiens glandulifera TaxID=253017 RepID=UPI001FB142CE|nr:non-specific lipid-transfer protein 4-like [Impatiens glandulifera]
MAASFLAFVVTMATIIIAPIAADINCQDLVPTLLPCLGYLTAVGPGTPSDGCCSATLSIANLAIQSQPNLQGVCVCLESVATSSTFQINMDNAKALSKLCKLPIDIPISTTIDCATLTLPKSPPSAIATSAPDQV